MERLLMIVLASATAAIPCYHFKGGAASSLGRGHTPKDDIDGEECEYVPKGVCCSGCCLLEYSADYQPWILNRRAPSLKVSRSCVAASSCAALSSQMALSGGVSGSCAYDGEAAYADYADHAVSVACLCNTPLCNHAIVDTAA